VYNATHLVLTPHIPQNLSSLTQQFPLRWGTMLLTVSMRGAVAQGISSATLNGQPLAGSLVTSTAVTLPWTVLPPAPSNVTIEIVFGGSSGEAEAAAAERESAAKGRVRKSKVDTSHPVTAETRERAMVSAMPTDTVLWLDASSLSLASGSKVASWPDRSGKGNNADQDDTTRQPRYLATAMNGRPAVVFDGASTFLEGSLNLPTESTIFAMFLDNGETTNCCSGIFFSSPGCNGIGTMADGTGATVLMADWSGKKEGEKKKERSEKEKEV
jgi:hypothetical protein